MSSPTSHSPSRMLSFSGTGQSTTMKAGPGFPGSPCGPLAPGSPCGPPAPGSPCGPLAPGSPCGPPAPGSPCGPLGPGSPCEPLAPGSPCGPLAPGSPCEPGSPCGPFCPRSEYSLTISPTWSSVRPLEQARTPISSNAPVIDSSFSILSNPSSPSCKSKIPL